MPVEIGRNRSMSVDVGRCPVDARSMPIDAGRCRSMPVDLDSIDRFWCRSIEVDAGRSESMRLDGDRAIRCWVGRLKPPQQPHEVRLRGLPASAHPRPSWRDTLFCSASAKPDARISKSPHAGRTAVREGVAKADFVRLLPRSREFIRPATPACLDKRRLGTRPFDKPRQAAALPRTFGSRRNLLYGCPGEALSKGRSSGDQPSPPSGQTGRRGRTIGSSPGGRSTGVDDWRQSSGVGPSTICRTQIDAPRSARGVRRRHRSA